MRQGGLQFSRTPGDANASSPQIMLEAALVLSRLVVLKLEQAWESPGELLKNRLLDPGFRICDSVGLGLGPQG